MIREYVVELVGDNQEDLCNKDEEDLVIVERDSEKESDQNMRDKRLDPKLRDSAESKLSLGDFIADLA